MVAKNFLFLTGIFILGCGYNYLLVNNRDRILYWVGVIVCFLLAYGVTDVRVIWTTVFLFGIYNVVFLCAILLNKLTIGKYLQYILWLFPTLLLNIVWLYYFANYSKFGALDILAIMQTNCAEAMAYCRDNVNFMVVCVLIAIIGVYILFCREIVKIYFPVITKIKLCLLIVIIVIGLYGSYRTKNNIFEVTIREVATNFKEYSQFKDKALKRKEKFNNTKVKLSANAGGLYVLVIGESHNRDNMHAYGYDKETTPWLDNVKRNANTLFFTKAFSCHTHTVPVLSYALTAKNQYNKISFGDAVSFVELANIVGYDTYWFSNQVKCGAWDTPISVIADAAVKNNWLNKHLGETTETNEYDNNLINELRKVDSNKNALIVFHLMDCHGSYEDRYPTDFNKFGRKSVIDKYDNAVLYNDYVIKNIYDNVSKMPNFKAMIYFSDHADAPLDGVAHDYSVFVPGMSHIPMYMLVSDAFIKNQSECFNNLKQHQDCVWTNDLLFNMMINILGIECDEIIEPENDLGSDKYNSDINRFKTGYGKRNIKDDLMFSDGVRPKKYWLHRMNDSVNLDNKNLMTKYKGIEIDIRYEEGTNDFDVNHDNHNGIDNSLRAYLSKMKEYGWTHKIWFDFKNLNEKNANSALILLNNILAVNGISKDRVIVESHSLEGNKIFHDDSYYTSFYLPYYKLEKMSDKEKEQQRKYIYDITKSGAINAVSFPAYEYDFVASVKGIENVDMLTWESGGGERGMWVQSYYSDFGQKLLRDSRIKVILVNEREKKYK